MQSLNFSRNFDQEPTRTIGQIRYNFFETTDLSKRSTAFSVEPKNLQIGPKAVKLNSINFTSEETYRGITPNFTSVDSIFATTAQNQTAVGKEAPDVKSYLEQIAEPLSDFTESAHYNAKLRSRRVNLGVTWSPYRVIGFPAAVIDDSDGPSITGTIAAISTNISANGGVSSTVSLSSCRIVEDLRENIQDGSITENMINEFTDDPYVDINSNLYDSELYGFKNIGTELYGVIQTGNLKKGGRLSKLISENSEGILQAGKGKVKQAEEDTGDYSILSYLKRDDEGMVISRIAETLGEDNDSFRSSSAYTKQVYEAIYALKDLYNAAKGDASRTQRLVERTNQRNLTTKEEYKNYIGIKISDSTSAPDNYKDAMELLSQDFALNLSQVYVSAEDKKQRVSPQITENQEKLALLSEELKKIRDKVDFYGNILLNTKESEFTPNTKQLSSGFIEKANKAIAELREKNSGIGIKDKIKQVIADARKRRTEVLDQIKKIENEIAGIVKEEDAQIQDITLPDNFATELFKPYNLTRGEHVTYAFKDVRKSGPSNFSNLGTIR